jgi:hypothetical protein
MFVIINIKIGYAKSKTSLEGMCVTFRVHFSSVQVNQGSKGHILLQILQILKN